jgi:hypothetical protein
MNDFLYGIVAIVSEDDKTISHQRTMGFYKELNHAKYTVENNICDIFEYTYNYMLVEEIEWGVFPYTPRRWMYKWNVENEKYEPCEEFKSIKHYFGFSIG